MWRVYMENSHDRKAVLNVFLYFMCREEHAEIEHDRNE